MATARIRGPSPPISAQIELTRAWAVIEQTERALIDSELLPAYQRAFEARTDRDDQDEIPRGLAAIFPSMASGLHAVATTAILRRATAAAGASTDRTSAAAYDASSPRPSAYPSSSGPAGGRLRSLAGSARPPARSSACARMRSPAFAPRSSGPGRAD